MSAWGLMKLLTYFQQSPDEFDAELRNLEEVPTAVDEVRKQVLEAHRLLLKLNPKTVPNLLI